MSNYPTMQQRYHALLKDAKKTAPNPAHEAADLPTYVVGMNAQGELVVGHLMTDSIYHFYVSKTYKTYKTHVPNTSATAQVTTMSMAGNFLPDEPKTAVDGDGTLYFVLLICAAFLLSRLAA